MIAIPSAPGTLRAKVVAACREREIRVRTLPTVFELLRGGVQLNKQLRDVQVEDVLGRDPVVCELDRVGAYLRDRIVLVTGAGGSIGSELCRQIARVAAAPAGAASTTPRTTSSRSTARWSRTRHFTSVESVLADCKEPHRMQEIFERFKPERRLPRRRLQARAADGGEPARGGPQQRDRDPDHRRGRRPATASSRFVLVSTDKAVNPKTVMGASKALAEWIVESARPQASGHPLRSASASATCSAPPAASCRSSAARSQRGGPVTVTHPEMTRYFMTIPEAVQLVIRAGDIGARRRGLRPRHGRAGADRRPRAQHDQARRLRARRRHRDRVHRAARRARSCTRNCSAWPRASSRPRRSGSVAPSGKRLWTPTGSKRRSTRSRTWCWPVTRLTWRSESSR